MSATRDCPFCGLVEKEKDRLVHEGNLAIVFLSNPRRTKGHTLVVPKRHVEKPWELTREERLEIFELIDHYEQKLLESVGTGCDIRQNYRPFMRQDHLKVDHVHYHILPRTLEDEMYQKAEKFERELFAPLPNDEADEVLGLLRD
jgi:histidine triad (HIT) family protein